MRLSKLSSGLAVQAVLLLAAQGVFAQQSAEASASQSAAQANVAARQQEQAPVQCWDGLSPQAIKRLSERESKPKVPAFQAELK